MSGAISSYPKIWQIGHRAIDGIFNSPVAVQEKVDGSQISFAKIGDRLHIRSKGAVIVDGAREIENLSVDGMFNLGVQHIAAVYDKLPEEVVFRGEYLNRPKHNTLTYDRVPAQNIVIFDAQPVFDVSSFWNPAYVSDLAADLGFEVVPTFFTGKIGSVGELFELLEHESFLGGPKIEGVVVKNYEKFTEQFGHPMFGKYVSEAFKESHLKDWKGRNPGTADVVTNLIGVYKTEPRWQKAVQHLREQGRLKEEPADIGPLMKELAEDLMAECKDEIMDELWKHFGKKVIRGVQGGFAEWYKEQLAMSAFPSEPAFENVA